MPWHIGRSAKCPAGKPWAVIKDADGSVAGCHPNRAAAQKQLAALYANEPTTASKEESSMSAVERRFTPGLVELRRDPEGQRARIGGYAIVFNALSRNLGGFVERAAPSVVNKSRADGWPEVVARFDHENAFLLGTIGGGTLRLQVDDTGLDYLVDPPTARADIIELVERGDVRKSSFAFRVPPGGDDWDTTDQGYPMRTLLEVQLVDVAPVVSPAYIDTSAGLRSLAARFEAEEDEVRAYAEADELRRFFTKTEAGTPASKPKKPATFGPVAAAQLLARKQDPWA